MDNDNITKSSIVVGIDTSTASGLALEWAAHEAARRNAPLHILHAYSAYYPAALAGPGAATAAMVPIEVMETLADRACADAADAALALHPTLDIRTSKEPAVAADALVEASRSAAMLVLGARGLGAVRSILLGSVSTRVAAHAHCPVVVVHEAATRTLADARVIVGVDGSRYSTGAIRFAFEQAASRTVGLTVVHAWQLDSVQEAEAAMARSVNWAQLEVDERSLLSESIAGFRQEYPAVDVRQHVVQGHPVEELVRQSENACLLVVGTRGRGPLARLLEGSVSQRLLREARCPVAVIRSAEDVPREGDGGHHLRPALPAVRERV